jgi:AhpC/TSA family
MSPSEPAKGVQNQPYGRYVGLLGLVILALITLNTLLTKPNGASGIPPGHSLPPFAVPLALSTLEGDANVAAHAKEGQAGLVPACTVRKSDVLNICELYEQGPVVLALFVNAEACPAVLQDMQRLAGSFPGVRFAAVAIKGSRHQLRRFVAAHQLSFPVGYDKDGALAELYKLSSCPQVTFAYRGGVVSSKALLSTPTVASLRARVAELLSASHAREHAGLG